MRDKSLIRQTKLQMPAGDARRLRTLIDRSERGELRPEDVDEYRRLAALAERISASRFRALAELALRRKQPIDQLKQEIGWREERHGA